MKPLCDTLSTPPSNNDLGIIFQKCGATFARDHHLTPQQTKVFRNIANCRTSALGGHLWRCTACHGVVPLYNSCLDRHCPKCQGSARRKWVAKRMDELLNVPYFHLVFTLPHVLNPLLACNPSLLTLLFRAVSQTLLLFGRDPKYLGAELGFFAILHTWDQRLTRHYHLHCLVPAGGLSTDGTRWLSPPKSNFLFPVKALSQTFRRLFWHGSKSLSLKKNSTRANPAIKRHFKGLCHLIQQKKLYLPETLASSCRFTNSASLENQLYLKNWVVYAKRPFGSPARVLKYLGRYTHRVAISNGRIHKVTDQQVTFSWLDRKHANKRRTTILSLADFSKRFLQHVLPSGFHRIRFFGFLAAVKKKACLEKCRQLLGPTVQDNPSEQIQAIDANSISPTLPNKRRCPFCHQPTLEIYSPIEDPIPSQEGETYRDTS